MGFDYLSRFLPHGVKPLDFFKTKKYLKDIRSGDPNYFDPFGLLVFCGPQGSGKTLSAVRYVKELASWYPNCLVVSNIEILGLDCLPYDEHPLGSLFNGTAGIIYFIDEIHLEWNSLESKGMSISEMVNFSQQRKQRMHIVGTSQVFMRIAKPLREQISSIVLCSNRFGVIQHNMLIDGDSCEEANGKLKCKVIKNYYFIHRPEDYLSYDSFKKIEKVRNGKGFKRHDDMLLFDSSGGLPNVRK